MVNDHVSDQCEHLATVFVSPTTASSGLLSHLGTPMAGYKYMRIPINLIPDKISGAYNLLPMIHTMGMSTWRYKQQLTTPKDTTKPEAIKRVLQQITGTLLYYA